MYSKKSTSVKLLQGPRRITQETAEQVAYFTGHRFSLETYKEMNIGEGVASWPETHGEPCLLFPLSIGHKVCVYKNQEKNDRWRFTGDGKSELWGRDLGTDPVLLVEGEWDCLKAIEAGYANVLTMGSPAGKFDPERLKGRNICIIFDVNDEKRIKGECYGQYYAGQVAGVLKPLAKSVKVVKLPLTEIGGDLELYLKTRSKEALDALIEATEPWKDPIFSVTATRPLLEMLYGSRKTPYTNYKKQLIVSESATNELEMVGRFLRTRDGERFFFFNETRELSRLNKDPFVSYLHKELGLNSGFSKIWKFVTEHLKAHCYCNGETVDVYRGSYWSKEKSVLYVFDNVNRIFKSKKEEISGVKARRRINWQRAVEAMVI